MNTAIHIIAFFALIATTYSNIVTFCIIHRMTDQTPWLTASWVIGVAGFGCFTWFKAGAYLLGVSESLPFGLCLACIFISILIAAIPRIEVDPHHRTKAHQ